MAKTNLIHIRVGKEMKKQMQRLIDIGMFSTESEITREGIRTLLIKYLKDAGFGESYEYNKSLRKNNAKKK